MTFAGTDASRVCFYVAQDRLHAHLRHLSEAQDSDVLKIDMSGTDGPFHVSYGYVTSILLRLTALRDLISG